ncbi:MAG TPA: hypothetical protein VFN75_09685 [Pseudonocardiaceae bacterium]|nr:hypothetical protein [Pseudonocardiaceae bacterium]
MTPATALLPGTVLAVRSGGFAGAGIRLGAALLDEPNIENHIAVVHHTDASGTTWAIEGRPGGVGWRNASDYLASRWTVNNSAQPLTLAQRDVIARTCEAMLGTPYDWEAIVDDGLRDLHLWAPKLGNVQGQTVCSALAAHAYDIAQAPRPKGGERLVQPADWDQWIVTAGWR